MDRLTTAQKIGIGGAVLLLIASFLPWYSVSGFGMSFSVNAWDAGFLGWGGVILGVLGGAVLLMKAMGKSDVKAGGLAAEQIALILAVASLVLVVLRLLTESSNSAIGLYLGIVAAAVTAFGCFQAMKSGGMSMDDMRQRFGGGPTPGGGPPAAP